MPEVTPPRPDLPPNNIRVKGKLLKIHVSENDGIALIELRVLQILGVGSATPLVAAQDTLRIRVTALPDTLNRGSEFIGILSHRQVMVRQQKKSTPWQLERIENEQNHN
ncbi:MAG: hypothetical protein JXR26_04570 [Balneolaceae bacterium]|nr:hypothetical protein [Balneolaceae bacterium]